MNGLSEFLVEGILNEATEKVVALFGGGFKPPTKGHLDVVNQGIKQNPEVSEIKILVGGGERNGFTQDQAIKIWNLYNDIGFIDKPATIIPVGSPFTYYKNYLKDNPDDKVYVFIGSRPDDEKDQMDVKQRSEFVKKYSDNVIPVEVATTGGVSGTLARKLFKTDIDGFRNMFPENLLDEDFDRILDILNNKSTDSTRKSAPKSTEPLTPQNENLILERIKFSPDEIKNIDEVLRRAKKIFKKGIPGWKQKERFEGVATMPFTSADGKEGKVSFYIDHLMRDGTLGRYNRKKDYYLKDDIIYLSGPFFTSAYAAIIPAVFNKVTGGNPDQFLLDTIKHELIHAKDPGRNQGYLKEPYNARDPKLYYGTWTEFPAQTGEFLEAISQHAEEKLRNNPNDEEIKIFERILQNILDVYAGKKKAFYNQTIDFIAGGSKKNVVQSFIKDTINIGGEIANTNTVPEWNSMDTFNRYYKKIQLIKKYNPEGYKKFLNDLYKEVKNVEKMTNFYLREKAKALGQTEYDQIYVGGTGKLNEGDPKKGTGKKPKGSGRRLYTDEDPSDTVGVKFSTRQDIVDTLNKKSFKAKSHARQSQIINLIHQRVRAAYGRAKDPAVKKRLKTGLDYITDKKEASKKKTERLKKQKSKNENIDPKSQSKHKGKAAPFGSAYEPVTEIDYDSIFRTEAYLKTNISQRSQGDILSDIRSLPGVTIVGSKEVPNRPSREESILSIKIDPYPFTKMDDVSAPEAVDYISNEIRKINGVERFQILKKRVSETKLLNENATYSSKIDYKQQIKDLTKHMIKKGMNILPLPRVIFKHGDQENASQFLGKTAYYSPEDMTVVLYTEGRHPKDIVRSFSHEMIHHIQNLEDRLHDISTTNTMEDDHLNDIEREAYTRGNMVFRNWTDNMDGEEVSSLNEKKKDPFGLNQYARELVKEFQIEDIKPVTKSVEKPKEVRIFNKDCGCDKA